MINETMRNCEVCGERKTDKTIEYICEECAEKSIKQRQEFSRGMKDTIARAIRILRGILERDANGDFEELCDADEYRDSPYDTLPAQSPALAQLLADAKSLVEQYDATEKE